MTIPSVYATLEKRALAPLLSRSQIYKKGSFRYAKAMVVHMAIREFENTVALENSRVTVLLSKENAAVLSIKTVDGAELLREETLFFGLYNEAFEPFLNTGLSFDEGLLTLKTALGEVKIAVTAREDYFIFEVQSALPDGAYCLYIADAKYEYDRDDTCSPRAGGVAMTVSVDPVYFPDGYSRETLAKVYEHLEGAKGAKYGLAIVPHGELRETLKALCSEIDPEKGIVLKSAGPWSRESDRVQGSYTMTWDCRPATLQRKLPEYAFLEIDHLDILHNDVSSFVQGDFTYVSYDSHEDFKARVTDMLATYGIGTSLHTYAQYINPKSVNLLSNPENRKMLSTLEEFTLAEDITAEDDFIPTLESTAALSDYYGFFAQNVPYLLIGEEIVRYKNNPQGFASCQRGYSGTKAAAHRKGEKIYHLDGLFHFLVPKHNSPLFVKLAHDTAEAYNRGGYTMLYIDAIDGTYRHCKQEERPYYIAKFIHELVKNCKVEPIVELSDMPASVWACRARMGAWDIPFRNLKRFIRIHHEINVADARRFYNCMLGWMNFYPTTDKYPGNQHTKYFHWEAIEFMGALSILYNYSIAYSEMDLSLPGARRNVEIYKFYDKLRRGKYFSEATLAAARKSPYELAVREKSEGVYTLVEKNYAIKRLYAIEEEGRDSAAFHNPFGAQTPFIRLEADMSTLGQDAKLLLELDEAKPVAEQVGERKLPAEVNLVDNLAMTVKVKGNGKKGTVALLLRGGSQSEFGYGIYYIDTDFEGWRDFVLLEADNGDRADELPFEKDFRPYKIYRSGLNMDRINSVELAVTGDVEGVYMSDVCACRQVYNVIKRPSITVGEESVTFECELTSTDFIEWDGKNAAVLDRYANRKPICFSGSVCLPAGDFTAKVGLSKSLNACPVNVHLTFGTTGKEIE